MIFPNYRMEIKMANQQQGDQGQQGNQDQQQNK